MKSPVEPRILRTALLLAMVAMGGCKKPKSPAASGVSFRLTLPDDLDPKAAVYVSGNVSEMGNWKANGAKMTREGNHATLQLPVREGISLEYKYTLGDWDHVEKKTDGSDIGNRTVQTFSGIETFDTVARFGGEKKSTVTGNLKLHENFESEFRDNERTLRVWLPPGYDDAANKDRNYPVLYMHDGQNLFDNKTSFTGEWHADETATRLIEAGEIEPIIIVGIDNAGADRALEYTGIYDALEKVGGESPEYAGMLVEEVMPFIAKHYRVDATPAKTGIAGSSLGGLVSLDIATKYPNVFGKIAACSPSVWWHDGWILAELKAHPESVRGKPVWIDMGTAENALPANSLLSVSDARTLETTLRSLGADVTLELAEGAKHNETAWSARFDRVLKKLYGTH